MKLVLFRVNGTRWARALPRMTSIAAAMLPVVVSSVGMTGVAKASDAADSWLRDGEPKFRTSMAQTGSTGLLRTPHAESLGFGQISLNYNAESNVDLDTGYGLGAHNTLLMGIGIFPHVEFVLQNSHKQLNGPPWGVSTGSDLSFSAKLDGAWIIPEEWFQVAVGANDFGGQVAFHKSYYAVASKRYWDLRFSLGYGKNGSGSYVHQMGPNYLAGAFGGVEYQPLSWLQLVGDYDGTGVNAGAKLFTPKDWLPYGMNANVTYQAFSNSETQNRDNQWIGVGLTLPLSGSNNAPRYHRPNKQQESVDTRALTIALEQRAQKSDSTPASTAAKQGGEAKQNAPVDVQHNSLTNLSERLTRYGFENVSVGTRQANASSQLVVRLENNLFNVNELDAIGVVLGLLSESIQQQEFAVVLLNNNLPVMQVSGTKQQLTQLFQRTDQGLPKLTVTTNQLYKAYNDVDWNSKKENDYRFKPRVIFSPSLYSTLGTEFGVFDYSLALSTNVQVPVWTGALVDVRHMLPLSHSDDFDDGRRFGNDRHTSTVDRILLHQGVSLPAGVMAQVSVGQIASHYQGGTSELRWQSAQGTHKLGLEASYYKDKRDENANKVTPVLGHYRYYFDQYDWAIEANAGRYWEGDNGFTVTSKHWFGDTSVNIYYQHTDKSFAGLNLSIPLTFRKDMAPSPIQLRGIDQWTWGYRTMVGNPSNDLNGSLAKTSDLQNNLDRNYYNRDRLSASYLNSNLVRLKDAYQRYKND